MKEPKFENEIFRGDGLDDDEEIVIRKKRVPEQKTGVTETSVVKMAANALEELRAKRPLVQCMTNFVTANFQANALLALGASPVMVDDIAEASQFAAKADALLINTGTVTKLQTDSMRAAVSHANMGSRPWVMDPAGVGALPLRTFMVKELMRRFPSVIRGNASEIAFLAGSEDFGRGVDSVASSDDVAQSAARLANVTRASVLVTGDNDYVAVEGAPLVEFSNGAPIMAKVTGMGCVQGAIAAAYIGALGSKARWEAALGAALTVGVAGEMAAAKKVGPGTFQLVFLDVLAALKPADIVKHAKAKIVPVTAGN